MRFHPLPVLLASLVCASAGAAEEPEAQARERLVERLSSKAELERAAARARAAKADLLLGPAGKGGVAAKPAGPVMWDYSGPGAPEHWGRLKPAYKQCQTGKRQSPIDIRDTIKVELEAIKFNYQPGAFAVLDNGHTIQVNIDAGNSLQVMGRSFTLTEMHFHRPAEERINGRSFDMGVHLIHKDAQGQLAVVAVLLDRGLGGVGQPLLQTVLNNLPLEKGEALTAQVALDPNLLLPDDRSYLTYMGSLTEPPCSEGVLWMVMRQPVPVSSAQMAIFTKLYPMNARPIQPSNGRLVKESP
ncbi:MAG TPA: carbonic anhydrase family protein [Burkholderiaceae bacterium]